MKLLTKNEIQDLKQKERGIEIREGAKLAQKIDTLRQTASQEEQNLARFRIGTLQVIQAEIIELHSKRDLLKQEIIDLTKERERIRSVLESIKIISN